MRTARTRSHGWLAALLALGLVALFGCANQSTATSAPASATTPTSSVTTPGSATTSGATTATTPQRTTSASPTSAPTTSQPTHATALVYRGPAACDGCAEAAAALLTRHGFVVHYIGKGQEYAFSAATLGSAAVYVQPGGSDTMSVDQAWQIMRQDNPGVDDVIRHYVSGGGHYMGLCMGGYLAGNPGFALLGTGDSEQYITMPGASVTTEANTLITVTWRGQQHQLFFQDGPAFDLGGQSADVLARYPNGPIAAAVVAFGAGRVAVVGPHPEATADWYAEYGLPDHSGEDAALGDDLLTTVLK